ncbi:hypothetical protein D0817_06570 [Flavobacterium cupreum]|uniref:DUF2282 domain-containing protein n=2 Tax=Flavobacterium TaxID=237 RepID=A0A4Y7UEV3_9FLAO|nr:MULTISPECIES: DUF6520 family protein [Flavobacterium]RUT71535.1 hypothetical protein D0817_06570 [Flavobacterium cupreum]TCN59634.1 hypothetical protein EV142_102252 [Flavobacterium circumlabens]TEB44906.1 hypothetical protein D0809_06900 [Flavobacterium circumlabens]
MRTIVKALVLPIAAFALASAGAVSTNVSKESKTDTVLISGYIHNPQPNSCQEVQVDCTPTNGATCMYNNGSSNFQVYRKASAAAPCNLQLFRPQ